MTPQDYTPQDYIRSLIAKGKTEEEMNHNINLLNHYKYDRKQLSREIKIVLELNAEQQKEIKREEQRQQKETQEAEQGKKKYPTIAVRLNEKEHSFIKAQQYSNPSKVVHSALYEYMKQKETPAEE